MLQASKTVQFICTFLTTPLYDECVSFANQKKKIYFCLVSGLTDFLKFFIITL